MKIFKQYKNLWMFGVIIVCAILFIVNFSVVVHGVQILINSVMSLLFGAMFAFVLNLLMDPAEKWLKSVKKPWVKGHARTLAIAISFLAFLAIILILISIVVPNLINAVKVLTSELPSHIAELQTFIHETLKKIPFLSDGSLGTITINWKQIFDTVSAFITKGFGNSVDGTVSLVSSVANSLVNLFVIVVFAIYVLSEKERFVKLYYFFTGLYMKKENQKTLTENLRIINNSFKAFVAGELIEACILTTMCGVGMMILQLPYALMISVLVGVINMIPMIGAFIGGGIGAFIIFTISPVKCIIFLVFLCIIQQIESNIFFPRIIGNRVGLPGIYVMITIVVGGSLFGVFGMVLGVPFMAAMYKIACNYFNAKAAEKDRQDPDLHLTYYETNPSCPVDTSNPEEKPQDKNFFNELLGYMKSAGGRMESFFEDKKTKDAKQKEADEKLPDATHTEMVENPDRELIREEQDVRADIEPLTEKVKHSAPASDKEKK